MGYYTNYTLEEVYPEDMLDYVADEFFGGEHYTSEKWYSFADDFKAFVAANPELTIVVYGEGEESGDIWRAFGQNGKTTTVHAEIVLKEPEDFIRPTSK